ncbi:rho GTPase-activating protein 45 isoform X1 [Hydra vulgaris]|uniref:rho GTPase-activating protein 45 isoform X1 n=1 Tax=Hydra vulgaris TaxID=6087 RepID=UPI00064118C9|nr:rho GTPase-activating protein 45 isoform X1 [Hydra vulgaris]
MRRSLIPGFIKRRSSLFSSKDSDSSDFNEYSDVSKESDFYSEEIKIIRERYNGELERSISDGSSCFDESLTKKKSQVDNDSITSSNKHRSSCYENIFEKSNVNNSLSNLELSRQSAFEETQMVDQEDIIALTRHVRNFSDALNNLRNTFKESIVDGVYNESACQERSHERLSDVLTLLKDVLAKYPPLHSPDILRAATNIIGKIKAYNYAGGKDGPTDFYAAIDQLALSFSSSVSDFLMGDKDMSLQSPTENLTDQFDDPDEDPEDDESYEKESDDFLEKSEKENSSIYNNYVEDVPHPSSPTILLEPEKPDFPPSSDELSKALLDIEDSVEISLTRTKVWAKYSKDILSYIERRAHLELEFCKQTSKLSSQTRTSILEGSYLPFQSVYVTALENDISFAQVYQKCYVTQFAQIVETLKERQKDHDNKRSKLKLKWKNELKIVAESRENLRIAKKTYIQKQKDLEKYLKQQQEGKEDTTKFTIGKKKHQEDFKKSADESEEQYKLCVEEANVRQHEIQRVKADVLLDLRQLIYQCDKTMKSVTIAYFKMMEGLFNVLPTQYKTLAESSKGYEEGQQFAEFVRLQQSTLNQAMIPKYSFEKYKGEGVKSSIRQNQDVLAISSEDFSPAFMPITPRTLQRKNSTNLPDSERPTSPFGVVAKRPTWGTGKKESATDDTDSNTDRSMPGSPHDSPTNQRKQYNIPLSDDEQDVKEETKKSEPGPFRNQKLSLAAKMHKFRKLRAPARCKECDSYVYFNGAECEKCGLICHKKCLEKLAIKCGNKRLPRKMTTFGVDFQQHLLATKRTDIPYIIEKCINVIDENGLSVKGIYRVSGVKSKVEKLCQQFESGGDLVDLSNTPPHFVASVLKLYLRQLPEPLLTFKMYPLFIKLAKESMNLKLSPSDIDKMTEAECAQYEEIISQLHEIVKQLPSANYFTVEKLIRHLKRVADRSDDNQMGAANLSIVFGPTLLRPEGDSSSLAAVMDMGHQTKAVELLILNTSIFGIVNSSINNEVLKSKNKSISQKRNGIGSESSPNTSRQESVSSVGAEFTREIMSMVDTGLPKTDESQETSAIDLKRHMSLNEYHDPDRESDILGDLPSAHHNFVSKNNSQASTRSGQSTDTDYESAHEQLSSLESLLVGDSCGVHSSPDCTSKDENPEDDNAWMERFGKGLIVRQRSLSTNEIPSNLEHFKFPINANNRKNSMFTRLETTTYSFSLGGTQDNAEESSPSPNSPAWVKRDVKDKVSVRKLKPVTIKATVSQNSSPQSSPILLKTTPFVLQDIKGNKKEHKELIETTKAISDSSFLGMDEKDGLSPSLKVNISKLQSLGDQNSVSSNASMFLKQAPPTFPKPKKTLDKKSWTADLIKSKNQLSPDALQTGSLNDKTKRRDEDARVEDDNELNRNGTGNKSVKEILTKFETSTSRNVKTDKDGLTERYV